MLAPFIVSAADGRFDCPLDGAQDFAADVADCGTECVDSVRGRKIVDGSCVAGAAVAGALSMTFGCALRAPHGGIFVFPVVDHTALYCVALAVGSVLGAVILSLLKKNRTDAE